jgi:hypothetical protein
MRTLKAVLKSSRNNLSGAISCCESVFIVGKAYGDVDPLRSPMNSLTASAMSPVVYNNRPERAEQS